MRTCEVLSLLQSLKNFKHILVPSFKSIYLVLPSFLHSFGKSRRYSDHWNYEDTQYAGLNVIAAQWGRHAHARTPTVRREYTLIYASVGRATKGYISQRTSGQRWYLNNNKEM